MLTAADLKTLIANRMRKQGENNHSLAKRAGLKRDAVRSFLMGSHVPSFDRLNKICAALGLELRIGAPGAVSERITEALGLPSGATEADVLEAIAGRRPRAPLVLPDLEAALGPVADRCLAEILASLADAWEAADAGGREDLRLRWQASFPDLARRVLSLSGHRVSRLAGGGRRQE